MTPPQPASDDLILVAPPDRSVRVAQDVHQALLSDSALQFDRTAFVAPKPPGWLDWVRDLMVAIAPFLKWFFWGCVAVLVIALLYVLLREIMKLRRPLPRPKAAEETEIVWRPDETSARDLLAAADDLARQNRYAEAVHLLLLRSVEDIQSRRPRALRISLTTREIASLSVLPEAARPAFKEIGRVVEASLFGGAGVDEADFSRCRRAYEDFAIGGWSA